MSYDDLIAFFIITLQVRSIIIVPETEKYEHAPIYSDLGKGNEKGRKPGLRIATLFQIIAVYCSATVSAVRKFTRSSAIKFLTYV